MEKTIKKTIKILIYSILVFTLSGVTNASYIKQWTDGSNGIYYNSGNVGINTTSPTEKLDVNGIIKAKDINADTAGLGEFVFIHRIGAYKNTGTLTTPVWSAGPWSTNVTSGLYSGHALGDLDGDGDVDLLVSDYNGWIEAYENINTDGDPVWVRKSSWDLPRHDDKAAPTLADLDGDGDADLAVGTENRGSGYSAAAWRNRINDPLPNGDKWEIEYSFGPFGLGSDTRPEFVDLDNDGDFDAMVRRYSGADGFYASENIGTSASPNFVDAPTSWDFGADDIFFGITQSNHMDVSFYDFNHDGLIDAFVGSNKLFLNEGTPNSPSWGSENTTLSKPGLSSSQTAFDFKNQINSSVIKEGIRLNPNGSSYIVSGNFGIGTTTPGKKLYVLGSSGGTQSWSTSDKRWKKNIKTIPSALENITKIRGVTYDWKKGDKTESKGFDNKTHYGVIAQEVEKIFPDLIDNKGENSEYKHVEYNGLIGILIEAIKELEVEGVGLETRLKTLEQTQN